MTIVLNGERRTLAGPVTILALLAQMGIDPRLVAVELNRAIVKRARYGEVLVESGAEIEIVAFVGGGSALS